MPRKRTTTVERTERVTISDETLTDYDPYDWHDGTIPGAIPWRAQTWQDPAAERHLQLAQRVTQQERAEELLADWAVSVPPGTPPSRWLADTVKNILRAGPGATPLQAKWGRDI